MRASLYIGFFPFLQICVIGLFLSTINVSAQQIRFKVFDSESGMSHYSIRSLLYDRSGFLWLGTPAGLNRYDGYSFEVYPGTLSDSTGISGNQVDALHEDQHGILWIGTSSGHVDQFVREEDYFVSYKLISEENGNGYAVPSSIVIKSITSDFGGNIWVGTSAGLFRLSKGATKNRKAGIPIAFEQINDVAINDLLIDQDGLLWVATIEGVLGYINPSSELLQQPDYNMDVLLDNMADPITRLYQLQNRDLIWGTVNGGVYRMDPDMHENIDIVLQNERNGAIKTFFEDSSGNLWIGTSLNGLHFLNTISNHQPKIFLPDPSDPYSISNQVVEKIVEDNFGNLWIGTWQGLNKISLNDFIFTTFSTNEIFVDLAKSSRISSIQEINDGELLLGTYGGGVLQFSMEDSTLSRFRVGPEHLDSSIVSAITYDDQDIWVGYLGEGIVKQDRKTNKYQVIQQDTTRLNSLSDDNVTSVLSDQQDRLWVGTYGGGVNLYDKQTNSFNHYLHDPLDSSSISSNNIMALFEDSDGNIWIGTVRGGLLKFDEATHSFLHYSLQPDTSMASRRSTIFAIHQTRPNYLWIGLEEGGLVELNTINKSFVRYDRQHGLPNNTVLSIESDDHNRLWLGTDNGLSKFDLEATYFANYSGEDGLQGNSFHANASTSTQSGYLYFGGTNGFTYFDPKNIPVTDKEAPPIVLVGFEVNNEPVDTSVTTLKQIELDYGENSFGFTFAALDFTAPDRLQYRYKLENYDDKWIQRNDETKRFANFTKVAPNDYVLHVQATNSAGIWSTKGIELPITIHPPYWQTWWFQAAVVLFVISLVYSAHQYRLTKQQQIHDTRVQGMQDMETLRMRIAGQLHDRVSANLSTIGLLAESLAFQKEANEKEKERFDKITTLARDSANSIRETSWVVNTGFDRLDKLVSAMEDVGEDMISVIAAYSFDALNPIPDTPITMDFRQNVYYFFREALHNIIKHAEASHVMVTVSTAGEHFELVIKDDGIGFVLSDVQESNGMVLFRRRARDLNGTVSIESEPRKETCIRLHVPIEKPSVVRPT